MSPSSAGSRYKQTYGAASDKEKPRTKRDHETVKRTRQPVPTGLYAAIKRATETMKTATISAPTAASRARRWLRGKGTIWSDCGECTVEGIATPGVRRCTPTGCGSRRGTARRVPGARRDFTLHPRASAVPKSVSQGPAGRSLPSVACSPPTETRQGLSAASTGDDLVKVLVNCSCPAEWHSVIPSGELMPSRRIT